MVGAQTPQRIHRKESQLVRAILPFGHLRRVRSAPSSSAPSVSVPSAGSSPPAPVSCPVKLSLAPSIYRIIIHARDCWQSSTLLFPRPVPLSLFFSLSPSAAAASLLSRPLFSVGSPPRFPLLHSIQPPICSSSFFFPPLSTLFHAAGSLARSAAAGLVGANFTHSAPSFFLIVHQPPPLSSRFV